MTETRAWAQLRRNDWFICPWTGQVERVRVWESRPDGRVWVNGSHHNHCPPVGGRVEITTKPPQTGSTI